MSRHLMLDSPAMGRKVHVWCYGHFGPPVIVFPTAAGFAHEWAAQGMVEALTPAMARGRLKLYCPESNVSRTWLHKEGDPRERVRQHLLYERFVMETLLPFVDADCNTPGIGVQATGASLGGFYAALFALKFPHRFRRAVCMSGRYQITHFTNGYNDSEVYLCNPLAFVANLHGEHLEKVRQTHLTLVCGQGKYEEGCIEETHALADLCHIKGIPHRRDIWGHDVSHDWLWWRRQAVYHLGGR